MRCLALAQAAQDAGKSVVFALAQPTPAIEARLRQEQFEVLSLSVEPGSQEDMAQTIATARRFNAGWVVVDGYHFGAAYQTGIKAAGLSLLFLDDFGHAETYAADIVVNQNTYASEALYVGRKPTTRLLLGTQYALLRREFRTLAHRERHIPDSGRNILVTLGGSDPENVTHTVIQALKDARDLDCEVIVVAGSSNPNYTQLQAAADEAPHKFQVKRNVMDMPGLMGWADMAIAAGGTTVWELAFMGLPALLIALSDNQRQSVESLDTLGAAVSLGWHATLSGSEIAAAASHLLATPSIRASMSERGQSLVDGLGASRVLAQMDGKRLFLRTASKNDCRRIWEWANDPVARTMSFSSDIIPWAVHVKWFASRLSHPHCLFLIAEDREGRPIGQIRYDINGREAVVSLSVAEQFRGMGYGSEMLILSAKQLLERSDVSLVHAYIKPVNQPSHRIFLKAGYTSEGTTHVDGCEAVDYVLER
jgi:UDP-2,4-diacetamido-2,4,6-trideoxy-beta-L-altropyranose hydrolase